METREEIKKMLMELILEGHECVKVYDTRKILRQPVAHNPNPGWLINQKDDFKAKVIYTCEDSAHQAVLEYVHGWIDNINALYDLEHPIKYVIKDFYGVNRASVTGKDAYTSLTLKGTDILENIMRLRAIHENDPDILEELDAAERALKIKATYTARRYTGTIYRCNFFSENENRSLQANVGNVLILSGDVHNTRITMGSERKHRISCYTFKEPDFTIRNCFYYKR